MYATTKNIVWDWNGTLIDDVDICIVAMNKLLAARNLNLLTLEKYRQVFEFPVKNYYKKIGFAFDQEPFEIPAMQFIDGYQLLMSQAKLFLNAVAILQYFSAKNYNQFILSAMEQDRLLDWINNLGIAHYFNAIVGIDNHFAKSKLDRAVWLSQNFNLKNENTLLIGDTLHDLEVAKSFEWQCLLISHGHQDESRLLNQGVGVCKNLLQVKNYL